MSERKFRGVLKSIIPGPIRSVLRMILHYFQRVSRWAVILWQIRGVNWANEWVLVRSAIASPVLSLHALLEWQDPILLGDVEVKVPGFGRFSLRARCDDLWHVLPWREQAIANKLKCALREGDVFVDAGANIGVYSVLSSRLVGSTGSVIAVEMMPDTADRLENHVRINQLQNVAVVRMALSDVADLVVTASVQADKHGQATIATDSAKFGRGKTISVRTTTLDEICKNFIAVNVMKMDLEGAELAALKGGEQTLSKLTSLIYESWGWRRQENDPVDEFLTEDGFLLNQLDGNNWLATKSTGSTL